MDIKKLRKIRKLVLISMFADDYLMDKFVLKGGSAIDLAYKIDSRASVDIDLSLENDFSPEELEKTEKRIRDSLSSIFEEEGYVVFDFKFGRRPNRVTPSRPFFWGGYFVEFKIISDDQEEIIQTNLDQARRLAEVVGVNNNAKKFTIDISKHEYCKEKIQKEVDGYIIYVYTPKMIVIEKLRAICQQMGEYTFNNDTPRTPRTRDFYDIYMLVKHMTIEFSHSDYDLLEKIFAVKEVPIELLYKIPDYKDYYSTNIDALKDTIPIDKELDFDIYFEFVLTLVKKILM